MADIEDILNRLSYEKVDTNKLIESIIFSDESSHQLIKNNFKTKVFDPLFLKLSNFYGKIGDEINKNSKNSEDFADPIGIIDLKHTWNDKFENQFNPIVDNIIDKLEKYFEKLESDMDSSESDSFEIKDVFTNVKEKFNQFKKFTDNDTVKDDLDIKTETSTDNKTVKNNSDIKTEASTEDKTSPTMEQELFDDEQIIEVTLSETTEDFLTDLIKNQIDIDNLKIKTEKNNSDETSGKSSSILSILTGLMGLAGLAMLVAEPLWNNFLKPYLSEKFNIDFKSWDELIGKFGQLWDGLSKWFFIGAGEIGLKFANVTYKSLAGILESTVGGFFNMLGAGAKLATGTPTTIAQWFSGGGILKTVSSIFGTFSKVALKSIPFIGSLFSFWFAWDDFQKGDIIGGSLNIASGIANLFGPIGWGISLGIDVLNAILEMKSGGTEGSEEQQTSKKDILTSWLTSIQKFLKKVPIIEWFAEFGDGIAAFIDGDYEKGIGHFENTPFMGPLVPLFRALSSSINVKQEDGSTKMFDLKKFQTEFEKNIKKWVLTFVPSIGGLRKTVAKFLGVSGYENEKDFSDSTGDESESNPTDIGEKIDTRNYIPSDDEKRQRRIEWLENDNLEKTGRLESLRETPESTKKNKDNIEFLESEILKNITAIGNLKKVKADDILIPSNNEKQSKQIVDLQNSVSYELNPSDDILAFKEDGVLDRSLNDIKNIMFQTVEILKEIKNVNSNQTNVSNVNVNNQQSGNNLISSRDNIFDLRMDYWKLQTNERVLI
jgi:hypothetical protein